jgi:hypothetical protein
MTGVPLSALRWALAFGLAVTASAPGSAQTNIFNSNGFDTGYSAGNLNNQQSFLTLGGVSAALVQSTTVFSANNAVQIVGPSLVNTQPQGFAGGNFWYQTTNYNPVASATPFVQVHHQSRTSGGIATVSDIPFAGVYLEGNSAFGQQSITPVMVNLNGGITVFTNTATGGTNNAVSTANGLIPREQWHQISAELNFATQTFRVYRNGDPTPLPFVTNGSGAAITPIVDVPFRNTFGTTTSLAEVGLIGFYGFDTGGSPYQPVNSYFVDNFQVTASAVSQFAPVPEPTWGLAAIAAGGLIGLRLRRVRRPDAATVATPA